MDVVLLSETLNKGPLDSDKVGDGKLENLRRFLAGDEQSRLGVLVLLRLALFHFALGASILGFTEKSLLAHTNSKISATHSTYACLSILAALLAVLLALVKMLLSKSWRKQKVP